MQSPEDTTPMETVIEKPQQEFSPESPALEVAEISNEDLEQHASVTESYVEQQTAAVLPEGEKIMESSISNLNVSPETLASAKQESGLDEKLQAVQFEADQLANNTKSDIASTMDTPTHEEVAEIKEKSPEKIREERRMEIIKELEREWEEQNGPMNKPFSESEIAKNKEMAKSWGEEWDGRTTTLTEKANEFFFDHQGFGKNSVPSQADKILADRFPEYAQKTEQPKQNPTKKTAERNIFNETPKPRQETRKDATGKLKEMLNQNDMESDIVKIENGTYFSEAIILQKHEIPTEKMVRIYRGINHLDASVLKQIPYAMRTEKGTGKPGMLENIKQEVDMLAKNPTYENLLAYTSKVRKNLSPNEIRRMDEDLAEIEDGILNGYSVKHELMFKQIKHNGGWGESGITPYISASLNQHEAAGYGNNGLVVIDMPLSEIEDYNNDGTEVNIKGALDKKYITAILPRKHSGTGNKEKANQEIDQILQKINDSTEIPLFDDKELRAEREKKSAEGKILDNEQQQHDVELVRQKRIKKLVETFPETKLDIQDAQKKSKEQGTDAYTQVKKDIFDQYKTRLEKIGRNGRHIEDYNFSESEFGNPKKFDRGKTNEIMLLKLRGLVMRLEEREEERNGR